MPDLICYLDDDSDEEIKITNNDENSDTESYNFHLDEDDDDNGDEEGDVDTEEDVQLELEYDKPRTTSMAKKSTSPIKVFLTSRAKTTSMSNLNSGTNSYAKRVDKLTNIPPQELSLSNNNSNTTTEADSRHSISKRGRSNRVNKNNRLSPTLMNTLEGDADQETILCTSKNKKFSNNLIPHEIMSACSQNVSTLKFVNSILTNDFDLDLSFNGVNSNMIKNKFIQEYKSKYLFN